jgi:hypothetical protein
MGNMPDFMSWLKATPKAFDNLAIGICFAGYDNMVVILPVINGHPGSPFFGKLPRGCETVNKPRKVRFDW